MEGNKQQREFECGDGESWRAGVSAVSDAERILLVRCAKSGERGEWQGREREPAVGGEFRLRQVRNHWVTGTGGLLISGVDTDIEHFQDGEPDTAEERRRGGQSKSIVYHRNHMFAKRFNKTIVCPSEYVLPQHQTKIGEILCDL